MTEKDAVFLRHSVRKYKDAPIPEEKVERLQKKILELNETSGLHMQLILDHPQAFRSFLAHYGGFRGAASYVAMVGRDDANLDELCGYYGEQLVLFARQLGLGTCWIGGTFSKKKTGYAQEEGERLCLIISIGIPADDGKKHRSKVVTEVIKNREDLPAWFLEGVKLALLAPTAINQQKFMFELVKPNRVCLTMGNGPFIKVDKGIIKYHFELGAGDSAFEWEES